MRRAVRDVVNREREAEGLAAHHNVSLFQDVCNEARR